MHRRNFLMSGAAGLAATGPASRAFATDIGAFPSREVALAGLARDKASRQTLLLTEGWRFYAGDIGEASDGGHAASYNNARTGRATGQASQTFDDSLWKAVRIPHDFVVETPFDPQASLSQGYRQRGVGWYRRTIRIDAADRGKSFELLFGGVGTNATVWFNGALIDRNWSGYNTFSCDVTSLVRYGAELNSLAVRADAGVMEGWWYEGGGLYRDVHLIKRNPLHIVTDGIHCQPRQAADGSWSIPLEAIVRNIGNAAADFTVDFSVLGPDGNIVAYGQPRGRAEPLATAAARVTLRVAAPKLWSIETPSLYTVRVNLRRAGDVVDQTTVTTGFRTFRFDPREGFFLNGKPLKIKGVCIHQDHAGVGVALPAALWDFRIRRLKEMGCNAVRVSHHAPAVEVLDACDRYGMLVMDETRVFNPGPDFIEQLEWLVRRDRNRACVFMWSLFNEEPLQGTEAGYEIARRMIAAVKALDPTRATTGAMNNGLFNPVNTSQVLDVAGFNYQHTLYDRYHAAHPDKPIISTEDTSGFMTRGAYETSQEAHVMASYDDEAARWGATNRVAWKAIAERPFVAGAFVWTGFDYRGEPTPFNWPSASSFFGMMDLCGFAKTAFHIRRAQWIEDKPVLHIAPHWNWAGREGKPVKVMVISNADEVELRLNGKSLGRRKADRWEMNSWQVPYAPGRLEAVSYKTGKEVAREVVETTGAPVALRLTPDRLQLAGDGRDATPVTVEVLDAKGRAVPTANLPVRFEIEGGEIIGLGNGNPNSHEAEKGDRRELFNGLAQVIVQTTRGSVGILRLRALAEGLKAAEVRIAVTATAGDPIVPRVAPSMIVGGWRQSPVQTAKPSPDFEPPENDQNSWAPMSPGALQPASPEAGFVLFRTRFTPAAGVQQKGGRLNLGAVSAMSEVWLDGELVAQTTGPGAMAVDLKPKAGERKIAVILAVRAGGRYGMEDVVTITE